MYLWSCYDLNTFNCAVYYLQFFFLLCNMIVVIYGNGLLTNKTNLYPFIIAWKMH